MLTFITVIILIVSILLILVVLAQNSKGGGMTAESGANQIIGAQRATDWIEKSTWTLSVTLFVLCLANNIFIDRGGVQTGISSPNVEKAQSDPGNVPGIQNVPTETPVDSEGATETPASEEQ
jgi:preprotein translocase subunit SecG